MQHRMRFDRTRLAGLLIGGLAVTSVGLGAAATAFADPTPTATPSAGQQAPGQPGDNGGPGGPGGHGRHEQNLAKELAGKLGLEESKVSDALKATREQARTTDQGKDRGGDPAARDAEMAKALAGRLGVDEAKVTAALTEIRTAHQAEHAKQLADRLAQAVTDQKLTQAEADAVKKAAEAGVIHG